ncbi:hypothetical protein SASPL_123215 [Salvia splendens]|uniref:Uncharacterized protein n=1 Tax=Salvia splendens TaxID=180675 RepID=A0A8X8ZSS7_SALSN|nr:hypothetical protein SASPL_123215 [Salvia splendens]
MDRPTCWDPPGQQGYPAYEQPPPFGWPTPPPTHMESLDRVFVEFRPQPPQLQRYQGETDEDGCYGDDFIHAHSPQLDESLDAYGCGYAHELREQKEVDSSPSSLVVQIGYSCARARDFDCFSERGMVNEMLCDKLEMKLSTYSISETKSETNEAIDGDVAYSEIGNKSNPAIGLPSFA